jgi:hypothetical protein
MPVTRHGRQQRKSGGVATKPEARRIAANIAKLPDLLKRPQYQATLVVPNLSVTLSPARGAVT